MKIKKYSNKLNFNKFSHKNFFLKFLENKGIISNSSSSKEIIKKEFTDIKQLLDEKNIQITFSDIFKDYFYFRKEYYSVYYDDRSDPNLPFEKKDTNFKNVFHYFFIMSPITHRMKLAFKILAFNIFLFIVVWRMKRAEMLNREIFANFNKRKEDHNERQKHNLSKWKQSD
jgi:hypothetical protein